MRTIVLAVALIASLPARHTRAGEADSPQSKMELPPSVDFDRHVASLLGRLGCNAGSCHGSFQGRGGLNLSLFGHDPARDFKAIVRGAQGRRVNVLEPDRSLVLLKATGQVPHEGGQRFARGSWEYRIIRAWIAAGASRDPARPGARPSRSGRPSRASNGRAPSAGSRSSRGSPMAPRPTSRRSADLRVRDDGRRRRRRPAAVRGLRPGDTAVVAAYNGLVAAAGVLVADGAHRRRSPKYLRRRARRPRSLRQAARAGHRHLRAGDRRRVPPPRDARRDRHSADAGRGPRASWPTGRPTSVPRRSTGCSRTRCTPRSGPPATSTSPAATSRPWKGPTTSARAGHGSGTTGSANGSP